MRYMVLVPRFYGLLCRVTAFQSTRVSGRLATVRMGTGNNTSTNSEHISGISTYGNLNSKADNEEGIPYGSPLFHPQEINDRFEISKIFLNMHVDVGQ